MKRKAEGSRHKQDACTTRLGRVPGSGRRRACDHDSVWLRSVGSSSRSLWSAFPGWLSLARRLLSFPSSRLRRDVASSRRRARSMSAELSSSLGPVGVELGLFKAFEAGGRVGTLGGRSIVRVGKVWKATHRTTLALDTLGP